MPRNPAQDLQRECFLWHSSCRMIKAFTEQIHKQYVIKYTFQTNKRHLITHRLWGRSSCSVPCSAMAPPPLCAQRERFEVWLQQKDVQSLLHSCNAQKVLYTLANKSVCKTACFFIVKAMLTSLLLWARHCLIPKEKVAINHHVYWLTVGGFPVLSHNAGGNWHREKGQQVRRKGHSVRGDDGQLVWGEKTERIPPRDEFVFLSFPPAKEAP